MRIVSPAAVATCLILSACGGAQTSQANISQANISNDSRPADNAVGSNFQLRLSLGDTSKIMHERHEGMEKLGKNSKAINRELTRASPDLAAVRGRAAEIALLSKKASSWFPKGTGPEAGKTGAKPDIWRNPNDFTAKLHSFQEAAAAFDVAAKTNDLTRLKEQFGNLGHACKACHDKYRSEMHH